MSKDPTDQVGAQTAGRAKAVVLYAAISGLALLVLIAHYPGIAWYFCRCSSPPAAPSDKYAT